MTIDELIATLYAAHIAYRDAPSPRSKQARYQHLIQSGAVLSNRLGEAIRWLDDHWRSAGDIADAVWIDTLHKYERGYRALDEAKTWL